MIPRLFCVIENASGELVYASVKYTAATSFLRSVPDRVRDCFSLVRYDADENWKPETKGETNANQGYRD